MFRFVSIHSLSTSSFPLTLLIILLTKLYIFLSQVNNLLNDLEKDVKRNPSNARLKVMSYKNACCSNQNDGVPPDEQFGRALVGCTLDDQKQARKRIDKMIEFVG